MTIKRVVCAFLLGILVSFYVFPIGIVGLPESLNTKQIMAVLGLIFFSYDSIKSHVFCLKKTTIISGTLAVLFSLWCFFCVSINHTDDLSYAIYVRSFFIWLSGAYCLIFFFRLVY